MITYTIKINHSKKTYTIRGYENGKCYIKYRSNPQGLEFCRYAEYWTQDDIKEFLKSNDYYVVK